MQAQVNESYDAILVGGRFKSRFRVVQPLGISSIGSYCRKMGKKILLMNPCQFDWGPDETAKSLINYKFEVLGISIHCDEWSELESFMEMARQVHTQIPSIFICVGGFGIGTIYQMVLKKWSFIDCIMLGEAELRFNELLDKLKDGKNWKDIDAIAYLDKREIKLTKCPAPSVTLSVIPQPATDFIEREFEIDPQPFIHYEIFSKRGCTYRCSFCSLIRNQKLYGSPGVAYRKIEDVLGEMINVHARFRINRFRFRDENFIERGKKGREFTEKLCKGFLSLPFKTHFAIQSRADTLDEPIIKLFKKAGCKRIFLGIESFSQRDLELYQKDINLETLLRYLSLLIKNGFEFSRSSECRIAAGMMIWNPYSDKKSLTENARFCKKYAIPPRKLSSKLNPFKNTKIWQKLKEDRLISDFKVSFKNPNVAVAFDVYKNYLSSEVYLTRENIRAIEKIAIWQNWEKDSKFDNLKIIRDGVDYNAYDLLEELANNLNCRYEDAEKIYNNISNNVQKRSRQIIQNNSGYKILDSIMKEKSLTFDKLFAANSRIEF